MQSSVLTVTFCNRWFKSSVYIISQNHKKKGCSWKGSLKIILSNPPAPEQGQIQMASTAGIQDCALLDLGCFQGWRLHSSPGNQFQYSITLRVQKILFSLCSHEICHAPNLFSGHDWEFLASFNTIRYLYKLLSFPSAFSFPGWTSQLH